MKKILLVLVMALSVIAFTKCRSTKASASGKKLSYAADIQPIMAEKCTPCHFPDKGGRIKPLNSADAVKSHINEIIRRIQLNPGEKGYMPFKKPKLSDSTINVFIQWRDGGLAE